MSESGSSNVGRPVVGITIYVTPARWSYWDREAALVPADYVAWTLSHVMRSRDLEWTAERADDWRLPWPGFTSTRYEAKAKREGRMPTYLIFRRRMPCGPARSA